MEAILAPILISTLTNDEWCMKVFNSSVENRVEKAREEIETARQHGAYSCLHKFRADRAFLTRRFRWMGRG
jgi:hypothetical protein